MGWIVMVRYTGEEMYQPYSGKEHDRCADALNESLWVSKNENGIATISVEQVKEGEE